MMWPMKCKYCERDIATQADYDTMLEGDGEHLCWSDFGERCIDADDALDNARSEIVTLKRQVEALKAFAKDCIDDFDCDTHAHRYVTMCRRCTAAKILGEIEQAKKGGGG